MQAERQPGATPSDDALMTEFAAFVARQTGLHFPPERRRDLARAMTAIARDGGIPVSDLRFLTNREPARSIAELLAGYLSVGETYFFREPAIFDALERDVLPRLIAARRNTGKRLRIWSAGCCTGEELYSMAILLERMIPDLAEWQLTLFGTDINPRFLDKARRGVYRDWSFRNVPDWIRRRYFHAIEPGCHAIAPELRHRATFEYLNLATDPYPGHGNQALAMDIVLCRNVLMYFEPDQARQVIARLHGALAPDGWLAVSPAEAGGSHLFPQFDRVQVAEATLYRKRSGMAEATDIARQPDLPTMPAPIQLQPTPPGKDADAGRGSFETAEPSLATQARLCADRGLLDEADRLYEAAIDADKCDPTLRYLHALVLEGQGRFDAATQALNHALYLDPSFVLAHFTLGNLCRRQRKVREANRHLANAFELLHRHAPDDVLTASDGVSAGHLFSAMNIGRRET